MSEQTVYDTFRFTGRRGHVVRVESGKEVPHDCINEEGSHE